MTTSYMHVDFETTSPMELGESTVYRYTEHPHTEILCMAWAIDAAEPQLWLPGDPLPEDFLMWLDARGMLAAWNDSFERRIWEAIAAPRYKFPRVSAERWFNPLVLSALNNLPTSLGGAAKVLGAEEQKDKEGRRLMLEMARGKHRNSLVHLVRLGEYCKQDVRAERSTHQRLHAVRWSDKERLVYRVSEEVNDRGVAIDVDFARIAAAAAQEYQQHVARQCQREYGFTPTQRQQIIKFCTARGLPLQNTQAPTIDDVLEWTDVLDPDVTRVLRYLQQSAATSPTKFAAMLRAVCSDGRLRGMFSYYGAQQTGRWSGRVVQLQNLPRPTMKFDEVRAYMEELRRYRTWECLGHDPLNVLVNCIRPTLIPGNGHDCFTVGDESSIEARVLAWLAGEEDVLDIFRKPDGDIYLHAATDIYDRTITADDKDERQIGKVATLALGFGGSEAAFMRMGRNYGVSVTEDRAEEIKDAWRAKRERTVMLWRVLDVLAPYAISGRINWGKAIEGSDHLQSLRDSVIERLRLLGIKFTASNKRIVGNRWYGDLAITLPSGRALVYHKASVEEYVYTDRFYLRMLKKFRKENGREPTARENASMKTAANRTVLRFWTPTGDQMREEGLYGGRLTENIVQAIARDVLAEGIIHSRNLPVVLHAHDEIAAEGDCRDALKRALTRSPTGWLPTHQLMADLPLAASVGTLARYWKQ